MQNDPSIGPKTFHLQYHITDNCNLDCSHCYVGHRRKKELSTEQALKLIDRYADMLDFWKISDKKSKITFTGGEPLLRKDIFKLIKRCRQHGITSGLMTNGTTLSENIIEKLKDSGLKNIQLSLEGLKDTNDLIRGAGVFDSIRQAIKLLKKHRFKVIISTTIHKGNYRSLSRLIEFCLKEKVDSVGFRRLVPLGNAIEIKDQLLSPLELRDTYSKLSDYKTKLESKLSVSLCCEGSLLAIEDKDHFNHSHCSAGISSYTILPDGEIIPCATLPIHLGNVLSDNLICLWYSSRELWKLRNINNLDKRCSSCHTIKTCKGGAKCIAHSYFGGISHPDPQCWSLYKELPKKKIKLPNKKTNKLKIDPSLYTLSNGRLKRQTEGIIVSEELIKQDIDKVLSNKSKLEKIKKILSEKYDLKDISSIRKLHEHNACIIETRTKKYLFKEREGKIELNNYVLEFLKGVKIPKIIKTDRNACLDYRGKNYILSEYIESERKYTFDDLEKVTDILITLHQNSRDLPKTRKDIFFAIKEKLKYISREITKSPNIDKAKKNVLLKHTDDLEKKLNKKTIHGMEHFIIHGDFKKTNLLFSKNEIYLCDFDRTRHHLKIYDLAIAICSLCRKDPGNILEFEQLIRLFELYSKKININKTEREHILDFLRFYILEQITSINNLSKQKKLSIILNNLSLLNQIDKNEDNLRLLFRTINNS